MSATPQAIRRPWNAWSALFPRLIAAQWPGDTEIQKAADASEESGSKMRSWRCLDGFDVSYSCTFQTFSDYHIHHSLLYIFWIPIGKTRFVKIHRLPWVDTEPSAKPSMSTKPLTWSHFEAWLPGHSDGSGAQRGWVDDTKRLSDKGHMGLANWTCTPGINILSFD